MRHPLLVATLCAALSPVAQSQTPPVADGPLVGLQLAFSIDPATNVGTPGDREAQPLWKQTGARNLVATPTPDVLVDFSPARMFRPYLARWDDPCPDIDAVSMGLDFIPADSLGRVTVMRDHWDFMVFSVRRGTLGLAGSTIRTESVSPNANEADLFHYVFPGASCIPPAFVGSTFKLADSMEIALPPRSEIDAADLMMNLYFMQYMVPGLGLPTCPTSCPVVYYSFSTATLNRVPASWGAASGATVFSSTWTGAAWTRPAVAYTPGMLGLADTEDIDGLAIDKYDPLGTQILFSTRAATTAMPDQLMFLQLCGGCDGVAAVPLTLIGGAYVSTSIGIDRGRRDDDVDAICIGDPICSGSHNTWEPVQFERTIGYPWGAAPPYQPIGSLRAQVLREPLSPYPDGFRYTLFASNVRLGEQGVWWIWDPAMYPGTPWASHSFQAQWTPWILGNGTHMKLTFPAALQGSHFVLQLQGLSAPQRWSHPLRITLR